MNKNRITNIFSILLLIIGCLQMAGYVFKNPVLRGLGFSYGASPLPTVFGTVKGIEGFSTRHRIVFINKNGETKTVYLDKKLFTHFNGSYLLKNAYSIFLAYPHVLKPEQVRNGVTYILNRSNLNEQFAIINSFGEPTLVSDRVINGHYITKYYKPGR
jgi:hypothetical protein